MCDDIIAAITGMGEDEKARLGRELFQRLDAEAAREVVFFIRPRCTEASISRGSFHKLADEGKVAWHPEDTGTVRATVVGQSQQGGSR